MFDHVFDHVFGVKCALQSFKLLKLRAVGGVAFLVACVSVVRSASASLAKLTGQPRAVARAALDALNEETKS